MFVHLLRSLGRGALLGTVALAVAGPLSAQDQGRTSASCRRARPVDVPYYTVSGAWSHDGDRLHLVDPARNTVLIYADDGRYLGTLPATTERQLAKYFPTTVKRLGDRVALELMNRRLVVLDAGYRPVERREVAPTRQIAARGGGPPATVSLGSLSMYDFAGRDVIACSDLKTARGDRVEWTSGIVRFSLDDPSTLQVFEATASELAAPEWVFCRLGLPLITAIGDTGFAFLMNERPGIYRSDAGAGELDFLEGLPEKLRERVELPEFTSPEEFVESIERARSVSMPVGIHGWRDGHGGEHLFMLYRQVEDEASTWYLYRLDPATGEVVDESRIHTAASAHLQAFPGARRWLFLEKGPVETLGLQEIEGFLLVDAEVLAGDLPDVLCTSG